MNLNELIDSMRVQVINTVHQGYTLKVVRFENEWFDAYEHHIPMFHQAQHIMFLLNEIQENPKKENESELMRSIGFIQGWMFSHEICTMNWLNQLNNQYEKNIS